MKFNCKPNQMVLTLDTCGQIEVILNAVKFAAFNPLVDDASWVAIFGADRSDLRKFFEEQNIAIDPSYKKGSYDAALKSQQTGK